MHAIRHLSMLAIESIASPTHDDDSVVDGGAMVTANAYVACKYFFKFRLSTRSQL